MYLAEVWLQINGPVQVRDCSLSLSNGKVHSCTFEVGQVVGRISVCNRRKQEKNKIHDSAAGQINHR